MNGFPLNSNIPFHVQREVYAVALNFTKQKCGESEKGNFLHFPPQSQYILLFLASLLVFFPYITHQYVECTQSLAFPTSYSYLPISLELEDEELALAFGSVHNLI